MPGINAFGRRLRRKLARTILPSSDQVVSRTGRELSGRTAFYLQQPTCQLPELWFMYERFLGRRTDGIFVEVGANDGVFVSNTWGLAEQGWRGLMIEPVPGLARTCRANHVGHPRVEVFQVAIGSPGTSRVTLRLAGPMTTANVSLGREYEGIEWAAALVTDETLEVACTSLDEFLLEASVPEGFDVLVVDVEGFEEDVFSGFDLARWTPKLLIVELADTHPDLRSTCQADARLGISIQSAGYVIVYKDLINTVFVRKDVWSAALEVSLPGQ